MRVALPRELSKAQPESEISLGQDSDGYTSKINGEIPKPVYGLWGLISRNSVGTACKFLLEKTKGGLTNTETVWR